MIEDRVMEQEAARRLGAEDDAITEHTRRDASQDAVGTPISAEKRKLLGG